VEYLLDSPEPSRVHGAPPDVNCEMDGNMDLLYILRGVEALSCRAKPERGLEAMHKLPGKFG